MCCPYSIYDLRNLSDVRGVETVGMRVYAVSLIYVALLAAAAVGCGGSASSAVQAGGGQTATTTVYFIAEDGSRAVGVPRDLAQEGLRVRAALDAAVNGPTAQEREDGVVTAIPSQARLQDVEIANSVATVDVSGLPRPGKPIRDARIVAQLVRTAVGLSGVRAIVIRSDGREWGLLDMRGEITADPYSYETLIGWGTVCVGRPGTETSVGDCFAPLP